MTEEQFSHLSATLHQAIDDEIEARIGKVVAVAEDAAEARQRTEALARKLADVTAALVAADGALAGRVEALENVALSFAPGGQYEDTHRALVKAGLLVERQREKYEHPKRPGLLSRLTRRTPTHQGAGPEGTE